MACRASASLRASGTPPVCSPIRTTPSRPWLCSTISWAIRQIARCMSSAVITRVRATKTPPNGGVSLRSRSATSVVLSVRVGLTGPTSRSGGHLSAPPRGLPPGPLPPHGLVIVGVAGTAVGAGDDGRPAPRRGGRRTHTPVRAPYALGSAPTLRWHDTSPGGSRERSISRPRMVAGLRRQVVPAGSCRRRGADRPAAADRPPAGRSRRDPHDPDAHRGPTADRPARPARVPPTAATRRARPPVRPRARPVVPRRSVPPAVRPVATRRARTRAAPPPAPRRPRAVAARPASSSPSWRSSWWCSAAG